jgi:hypothetical protein
LPPKSPDLAYLLTPDEQVKLGKKYNWEAIRAGFLGERQHNPKLGIVAFAEAHGLPSGLVRRQATAEDWLAAAESQQRPIEEVRAAQKLARYQRELERSRRLLRQFNDHLARSLRNPEIKPIDLKRLADSQEKVLQGLALAADPEAHQGGNTFQFVFAVVPGTHGQDGRDPAVAGARVLRPGEVSSDLRGSQDREDGPDPEMASSGIDVVAAGLPRVVPRPVLPAGKDGRVAQAPRPRSQAPHQPEE